MRVKQETITPQKAELFLRRYYKPEKQRRPSRNVIASYASAMIAGEWGLSHQGIAITTGGELIDGMHRLMAVVESGVTIDVLVCRDIENEKTGSKIEVMDMVDRGYPRGVGQQLVLRHGIPKSWGNHIAAMCRTVVSIPVKLKGKFSVGNALHVWDVYKDELLFACEHKSGERGIQSASVGGACVFAMKVHPRKMRDYYIALSSGEGLKRGDPALAIRRWIIRAQGLNDGVSRDEMVSAVLHGCMKEAKNEKFSAVRISANARDYFILRQRDIVNELLAKCGIRQ